MTYHTNHIFCTKCNHNDSFFEEGVIVEIKETISTPFLDNYLYGKVPNHDFKRVAEKKEFFNKEAFQKNIDLYKLTDEILTEDDIAKKREKAKKFSIAKTVSLKEEVIDWLNENIEDKKDITEDTPINDRKGWFTGNAEYNSREPYQINVFFARQLDALKFIERWSIYKKPTFYFDYFHMDRREMDIKNIIQITNDYGIDNGLVLVDIGDVINLKHEVSTDLDESTYTMIDWEEE